MVCSGYVWRVRGSGAQECVRDVVLNAVECRVVPTCGPRDMARRMHAVRQLAMGGVWWRIKHGTDSRPRDGNGLLMAMHEVGLVSASVVAMLHVKLDIFKRVRQGRVAIAKNQLAG